jgi:hypothetical protein
MEDNAVLPLVNFIDCEQNLHEYLPNGLFGEIPAFFVNTPEKGVEIPTLTVLHDYIDSHGSLIKHVLIVLDNMTTPEFTQDVDLLDQLVLLLGVHLAVWDFLADHQLAVDFTAHLENLAVLAAADQADRFVGLHNLNIHPITNL